MKPSVAGLQPGKKTNPARVFVTSLNNVYIILSIAMFTILNTAKADIVLGDIGIQSQYQLVDDATTEGYDIMCTITYNNISDNVDANNQISANGTFGSSLGLYKIDTDDVDHSGRGVTPPTYTISADSFNIQYASETVNEPTQSDTFNFYFNLGDKVTTEAQAEEIVNNLNA